MEEGLKNEWSRQLLFDIPSIDKQHSGFFSLINKMMKKNKTKPILSREDTSEILDQLEDYLNFHFSHEENLMHQAGYKKMEEHVREHKYFIHKIDEYKQEQSFNSPLLFDKLLEFMKKWFLSHIIKSDYLYKEDIKKAMRDGNDASNLIPGQGSNPI